MRPRLLATLTAALVLAAPAGAGVIRGHVFEARTNFPMREARAFIMNAQLQATTDSTGMFWLEGVPSGDPVLRVQAPWHEIWEDTVHVAGGLDTVRIEIPLIRVPIPGTLSGLVISEGGKPVRHAHVRINGLELEQMTEDDGTFAFYGAPPRPDTMHVSALSYDPVHASFLGEEARVTAVVVDLGRSLLAGGRTSEPVLRSPVDTVACIRFTLPDTAKTKMPSSLKRRLVTLDVLQGERSVRKLMWWKTLPGNYTVAWDGRDDAGKAVPAGKYLWRMSFDSEPPIDQEITKP